MMAGEIEAVKLALGAVELGIKLFEAVVSEARRPGATTTTMIQAAQTILDRAKVIEDDVDRVARGEV
jgi:urease gamma subunit